MLITILVFAPLLTFSFNGNQPVTTLLVLSLVTLGAPSHESLVLQDYLSLSLLVLTLYIGSLMGVLLWSTPTPSSWVVTSTLTQTLSVSFLVPSSFFFYLGYELSLVPIALMVFGWGFNPERLQAGLYLLFYTLVASLPLLFSVMSFASFHFLTWGQPPNLCWGSGLMTYLVTLSFVVNLPVFMFHLWLPLAHVEAPCTGSIVLAGVLLKLGVYGVFRFTPFICSSFMPLTTGFVVTGGLLAVFGALFQADIKAVVAYSSVVHMAFCFIASLYLQQLGVWGAIVMLVAHGLCSSALFFLATVAYETHGSRTLLVINAPLAASPALSLLFSLALLANSSVPPSMNLFAEVSLLITLLSHRPWVFIVFTGMSLGTFVFSLYLFTNGHAGRSDSQYTQSPTSVNLSFVGLQHLFWLFLAPLPLSTFLP